MIARPLCTHIEASLTKCFVGCCCRCHCNSFDQRRLRQVWWKQECWSRITRFDESARRNAYDDDVMWLWDHVLGWPRWSLYSRRSHCVSAAGRTDTVSSRSNGTGPRENSDGTRASRGGRWTDLHTSCRRPDSSTALAELRTCRSRRK